MKMWLHPKFRRHGQPVTKKYLKGSREREEGREGGRERKGEREEAGRGREGCGIFNEGGSLIENGREVE